MSEKQIKRIHTIYGVVITVLLVALGVWAIASCIMIYKGSDTERFLPEKILPYLIAFSIPLTFSIAAIIIGIVLNAVYHIEEEKPKAFVRDKDILKKLYANLDLRSAPDAYTKVIKSQRGFRHAFLIIMIVNIVINAISCISYLFTNPLLKAQLNLVTFGEGDRIWSLPIKSAPEFEDFFPIACTALAYLVIPFFVAIVYDVFAKFTYEKELEAVKAIYAYYAKNGYPVSIIDEEACDKSALCGEGEFAHDLKNNAVTIIKHSILVFSVLLIVIGIVDGLLGGTISSILTNAVNLCTGCVGLG